MTRERRRINEVKAQLDEVRRQLREVEADRDLYRNAFIKHLKWFIKLLGENSNPSLGWLIEDMSKTLNKARQYFLVGGNMDDIDSQDRCQDCKQVKPDVSTRPCPFAQDVHNEEVQITVCDDCCHERAMDI